MNIRRLEEWALVLHPADPVAVLKRPLPAETVLAGKSIELRLSSDIPAGHQLALRAIADGAPVLKYGQIIGFARGGIAPGDHVHVHNLGVRDFQRMSRPGPRVKPVQFHPPERMRFFEGYSRPEGRVGTRNYVAVVSTVNCSAGVSQLVKQRFVDVARDYPHVERRGRARLYSTNGSFWP